MPRAKDPITDEERSRRFIEKGREIGADSPEATERADQMLRKILKSKEPPKKAD